MARANNGRRYLVICTNGRPRLCALSSSVDRRYSTALNGIGVSLHKANSLTRCIVPSELSALGSWVPLLCVSERRESERHAAGSPLDARNGRRRFTVEMAVCYESHVPRRCANTPKEWPSAASAGAV